MNRTQVILRNIISNWIGFAVQAAVIFMLTPLVLGHLGDTRYGVWVLITSITGYYGLLALGFQGGVNQYLTRYWARRDFEKMNMAASTALVTMSCVGLSVIAVSLLTAWLAPRLFDIPPALRSEVFWCLIMVGFSIAVQLTLFLYAATFMATQRYDLLNLIGISTRLLSAALVYIGIQFGFGLIGICLATTVSDIVGYVARWRLAHLILPKLKVKRNLANLKTFHEMFSFGMWSFLIAISQSIFTHIDAIVIGALMPIAALAPYALAEGLVRQLEQMLRPIDQVFFPAVTELHAREKINALRSVYLRGSRLFLVAVTISAVLSGFWAKDFYRLWVGERYISGEDFPSVALLFHILLFAMIGRLFPGLGAQVLQGSLHVKPLAIVTLVEAAAKALLSIVLIRNYGLTGVALGALVSVLVFRTFTIPWLVGRRLDIPLVLYVRQAVLKPVTMAIILSLAVVCIRSLGDPAGFGELFVQGALAAVVAAPLALFIGMTRDDRTQVVYKTVNAAWSWLTRRELDASSPTLEQTFPLALKIPLRFTKYILPARIRHRFREAYREFVFRRAMKRFLKNPEACKQPDSPIVLELICAWGNEGWCASAEYIAACIDRALKSCGPILECGSGLSTVLVGAIASKRGICHWALEHSPGWATKVQPLLNWYKLDSVVLCLTPLCDYGDFDWYDAPLDSMPHSFSLVICDGPPGDTTGGRYGLAKVMKERLEPGCVILLDDATREQELIIAKLWEAELDASLEYCGAINPYVVLKVQDRLHQYCS